MTTYYVRDAISSDPSALSHWGRQVENTLYLCYQDTFEVGEFKSDKGKHPMHLVFSGNPQ